MILFSGALEAAGLVSDSRYILTKGAYFGGEYRGQGLYMAVSSFGWAMLSVWQLYLTLKTPILREKLILLVIVIASWVFIAGTGTRGPFLNYIITLIIAFSVVSINF